MRSREEYLVEFEAKLLGLLKDVYTSVNYNLTLAFSLSMLVVLIRWEAVTDGIPFLGVNITLSRIDMLILMPIVISIIYFLINYQLLRIAKLQDMINRNADELLSLNYEASPMPIREIRLYGTGVTGLIIFLARWLLEKILETSPLKSENRPKPITEEERKDLLSKIPGSESSPKTADKGFMFGYLAGISLWMLLLLRWIISAMVLTFTIVLLFLLPLIMVGYCEYIEFFYHKSTTFGLPLFSLLVLILIAIYTFINGLRLIAACSTDLIEKLQKDYREFLNDFFH